MAKDVLQDNVDFQEFARKVLHKSGLDLQAYKPAQVQRRLNSLRERKGFPSFRSFFAAMERDAALYGDFLDQLTINVTEFFRNSPRWAYLTTEVAPEILRRRGRIRCWSAACSTGEEPYSLVMALSELTDLRNIEVLATDLDPTVLEKARAGRFSPQAVKEVPRQQLDRFFQVEGRDYVITDSLQRRVQFARHNLLADPFGHGYDLVVCRNVMIYFTDEAKQRLYQKFYDALHPGGYLFVGGTEQIMNAPQYGFQLKGAFFYQKV